jgi:hypothetical protein
MKCCAGSELNGFFLITSATEDGREICNFECQEPLCIRFFESSIKRICKIRFNGSTGGQMGQGITEFSYDYLFFYGNENASHHFRTGIYIHKGIISVIKWVDSLVVVCFIILWCGLCDIILSVHAPV